MNILMNLINQTIYDQAINASYTTVFNKFKAKIFDKLYHLIKESNDPLIKHNIAGFTLLVPFSHNLPFILKRYPHYSSNLARIAKYVKQKYDSLKFIDIGANIGDSIAILRKEDKFPILCVEGEPQFCSILQKNISIFPDVEIVQAYVGEMNKSFQAVTTKESGTAHLVENTSTDDVVQVKRLSDILKEKSLFLNSKMIKIDTDGFDCKIIRGATDFLSRAKPVIFFEYDPFFLSQQEDDGISIFKILSNLGYKNLLVYDNFGDLILSTQTTNLSLLEELHIYFSGRMSLQYCDVCVFHDEDSDLFAKARCYELQFFQELRGSSSARFN